MFKIVQKWREVSDMQEFDAIVIGSGISGACTARELARWQLRTAVLEKDADSCTGATKGNSATVHSGHDAAYGTKKAYYNVRGNAMYDDLCRELSVPFRRNGTIVFAASETELAEVRRLKKRTRTVFLGCGCSTGKGWSGWSQAGGRQCLARSMRRPAAWSVPIR